MFDTKPRQQLTGLLASLREWEQTVTAQAQGFHRVRRLLQSDIEAELQRLLPRKAMAEAYAQRHQPLAKLAQDLDGLERQSQQLEDELDNLLLLFEGERPLKGYGKNMAEHWREELHGLTAQCERETDLLRAEYELQQIAQAIRIHVEALRAFQSADRLIRQLGAGHDTLALENELHLSREAMAAGRVSSEEARQLKRLCAPLEALMQRPEPQELQNLSSVLAEIRDWNRLLDTPTEQERHLSQRYRQLSADWRQRDEQAAHVLLKDAEALREQLAAQSRALRESSQLGLETLLDDLVHAIGPQPEIRQRLDLLKQGHWDNGISRHKHWLEKFHAADTVLKAVIDDQELAMEKRLRERCAGLRAQLHLLQEMPLATGLRQKAEDLEQAMDRVYQPKDTSELLHALRLSSGMAEQVAELEGFARRGNFDMDSCERELRDDNSRLLAQAARIGCTLEDISPAIDELVASSNQQSLEQIRELAKSLAKRLDNHRHILLQYCRIEQEELVYDISAHQDALRLAGFPVSVEETQDEPAEIDQFVDYLERLAQERRTLEQRTMEALDELEQRYQRLGTELAALDLEQLSPEQREEATDLLAEIQVASPAIGPLGRLRGLAATVEACTRFLRGPSANQQDWQTQRDVL